MRGGSLATLVSAGVLARGRIVRAVAGELLVEVEGGRTLSCDVLVPGVSAELLRAGDPVLVLLPAESDERACVLGVVRPYEKQGAPDETPGLKRLEAERIVIEAERRIELRVGESAVVIGEDGTITVLGRNVVSRARALNRIRGAAVRIN